MKIQQNKELNTSGLVESHFSVSPRVSPPFRGLRGERRPSTSQILPFIQDVVMNKGLSLKSRLTNSFVFFFIIVFTTLLPLTASAQTRIDDYRERLEDLAFENPGLDEKVDISLNNVSVREFLRGLAKNHKLNISVDPGLDMQVVNNFANVTVRDVLLFLVKEYDLDIDFTGQIMSFSKHRAPPEPTQAYTPKKLNITYSGNGNKLSLDLKNDSLYLVAREITRKSGKNVILAPGLGNQLVTTYIQEMPFGEALNRMAYANDLSTDSSASSYFIIPRNAVAEINDNRKEAGKKDKNTKERQPLDLPEGMSLEVEEIGPGVNLITLDAVNVPVIDVIKKVSYDLGVNYFLFSEPPGKVTMRMERATIDEFMTYALNGNTHTFKKEGSLYLIGDRTLERLRESRIVQMQYRSVEKIEEVIPAVLKKEVNITPFPELNSLLLSGSGPVINEVDAFLKAIDQIVPVVQIEVMIVDVNRKNTLSTQLSAGIADQPVSNSGTLTPGENGGIDFTWGGGAFNKLINALNGTGIVNIGQVTPNFYVSLQALESQGLAKVNSTPKLATLNGHEASMSIGNTEYYLQESTNIIGTQNPQTVNNRIWQPINANLTLSIKPIVSGDDQVTLEISVEQSDFTERIVREAPPGSVSRNFESLIRVRNGEMIVLGGLLEKSRNNSGSGVPFLARIPILKWFFSSRVKESKKSKLNVLIKPTIIW